MKSSGVSAASLLPSSGSTTTERGDSAIGTGAAEPSTTIVSVRAGIAFACCADFVCPVLLCAQDVRRQTATSRLPVMLTRFLRSLRRIGKTEPTTNGVAEVLGT